MATPNDPYRVKIPGVTPQQPAPRSPLRRPDSPANFAAPRNAPGTIRGEIPLYPGGDATQAPTAVVPRPERAVAMERAIATNNERIATQGAAMRAKAQAAQDANTAARLDPNTPRNRAYGVDAVAAGMAQGAQVAAPDAVPTATGIGTGDIGLPANVRADIERRSASTPPPPAPPAPRVPGPSDADYDPFAKYSDAELRTGKVDATESGTGYFAFSDGRVRRLNSTQANDPANQVSGLQRKALTPEMLNVMGMGDMDASAVTLNMAPGTNPLEQAARSGAGPVTTGAAAPSADQRYEALLRTGMSPAAARAAADSQVKQDAEIASALERNRANGTAWGAPTPPPTGTPASGTTPTGVTTVASGTGSLGRRSAVDEFNSIRDGLARPAMYDPSGATSRARGAATSVVRSNSDANRILQMAANLASDPRLKGFPGARNAIIQGLVGQIGAESDASLEGLRQAGQAGVSGQEFDQAGALQETGRRGQVLRDQFLTENEERLARINNDADMQQLLTSGAIQLEAARIGGRGRSGSGGNSEQISRADDYLKTAMEMNPEDSVAAGLQAYERAVAAGLDVEGLPGTQEAYQSIVGPLRDQFNTRSFVRDGIESLTTGNAGSETRLGYDFNINDLEVPEDQPWMVDLAQIISPASSQPYVVQQRGKPESARVVRPLDGAPSEAQLRRVQMLERTNLQRRGDFE